MPKLVSIQDRGGWAIPGFRAGSHTLRLDKELKDWEVHVRGQLVFLIRGTQVEELPRTQVRLSWELSPGETREAIDTLQKWSPPVQEPERKVKK